MVKFEDVKKTKNDDFVYMNIRISIKDRNFVNDNEINVSKTLKLVLDEIRNELEKGKK